MLNVSKFLWILLSMPIFAERNDDNQHARIKTEPTRCYGEREISYLCSMGFRIHANLTAGRAGCPLFEEIVDLGCASLCPQKGLIGERKSPIG